MGQNPLGYSDPDGQLACAGLCIGGAIVAGGYAAFEFVLSVYDAYDTYQTITDPCTSNTEKLISDGLLAAGMVLPGGGYSKLDDVAKGGTNRFTGRNSSKSFDTGGPTTSRPFSFPQDASQTKHIFRDAPGHLADTPANRKLLQGVANDSRTTLGTDRFGNSWFARSRADGSQVWVQTRNGTIQNGGVDSTPRTFNSQTGLSGR